jgi:hypothetical protein
VVVVMATKKQLADARPVNEETTLSEADEWLIEILTPFEYGIHKKAIEEGSLTPIGALLSPTVRGTVIYCPNVDPEGFVDLIIKAHPGGFFYAYEDDGCDHQPPAGTVISAVTRDRRRHFVLSYERAADGSIESVGLPEAVDFAPISVDGDERLWRIAQAGLAGWGDPERDVFAGREGDWILLDGEFKRVDDFKPL